MYVCKYTCTYVVMRECVCMYVRMYRVANISHTCIHTCMYANIHMYAFVCESVYVCVYLCTGWRISRIPAYIHVCMQIYTFTYVCICFMRECVCMYLSMYTYTCVLRQYSDKTLIASSLLRIMRGGGLGSSTIFKKINQPYAPS